MSESSTPQPQPTQSQLDGWIADVCDRLGVEEDVVTALSSPVLDMVRDVAHGISRPSAPLTAFILGLSAAAAWDDPIGANSGDSAAAVRRLRANLEQVRALVRDHAPE